MSMHAPIHAADRGYYWPQDRAIALSQARVPTSSLLQANQSETFQGLVARFQVSSLPIPGWKLLYSLDLDIEQDDDGWFVVSTPRLLIHGYGSSIRLAIHDYWECLGEYLELVEASAAAGDPQDARLLRLILGGSNPMPT
jgi:hypothetical protein